MIKKVNFITMVQYKIAKAKLATSCLRCKAFHCPVFKTRVFCRSIAFGGLHQIKVRFALNFINKPSAKKQFHPTCIGFPVNIPQTSANR